MNLRPSTPARRRTLQIAAALVFLFALVASGVCAQVPSLPRVDSLLAAGEYDQARSDLERWWSAREEFDVPGSDRARALMLRARLAPDMETAEPDYLAVVLGYPTSEHAPDALLRLGQGLLAAGEPVRAADYLQRLTADYPGRPQRTVGLLWLARAGTAAGRSAAACSAAREGLRAAAGDSDLVAMLHIEEAASCTIGSADAGAVTTPATARPDPPTAGRPRAAEPAASPAPDRPAGAEAADGGYAAQTGAFSQPGGARALAERLRAAGHEPRTVLVPASDLFRVRVGRFASTQEAARLVVRLRSQGFDAYVVGDVRQEREP